MVELAIVLPTLLLVTLGAFELYASFSRELILTQVVRRASAVTAKTNTAKESCQAVLERVVKEELDGWGLEGTLKKISATPMALPPLAPGHAFQFSVSTTSPCVSCAIGGFDRNNLFSKSGFVYVDADQECLPAAPWELTY